MASRLLPSAARAARPCYRLLSYHAPRAQICTAISTRSVNRVDQTSPAVLFQQRRRLHDSASKPRIYDFDEIKSLSSTPVKDRILIDVREPSEYAEGHIPNAINLPIKTAPEAILLPADEFEDRFDIPKPTADQEVVFYCLAGVRSAAAAKLAGQAGYQRVAEYPGSWKDWAAKGGETQR